MSEQKINNDIEIAKQNLDNALDGITMQEYAFYKGKDRQRQLKICINKFDNVIDVDGSVKKSELVIHCEHFRGSLPCLDSKCPYHKDNVNYASAQEKFKDINFKHSNDLWNNWMKEKQQGA